MTRRQKVLAAAFVAVFVLFVVAMAVTDDGESGNCGALRRQMQRLTQEVEDRDSVGADASEQRVDLLQSLRAYEAEGCGE